MANLIDRVAKAICKSRTCEGMNCCQWPANGGRTKANCPVHRGGYEDAAKAAIEAMREPTDEMIYNAEGYSDFMLPPEIGGGTHEARLAEMKMSYQVAIDIALGRRI